MYKKELVKKVANDLQLSEYDVNNVLCDTFNTIMFELVNGNDVRIRNFGTFTTKVLKAKKGYDFKKGKTINIEERRVPTLRFCGGMKVIE